jgi:ADP-ribose pyrophosphatase YjhB (NUDIX family)
MDIRCTSRVVLFDSENRVLLQKVLPLEPLKSQMDSIWICPGGKMEEGESLEECAVRELYEETGINGCEVGPVLWHGSNELILKGVETIFDEHFLYARLEKKCTPTQGDDPTILEHKWWNIDDLISQKINILPFTLPALLKSINHSSVHLGKTKEISHY